MAITHAAFFQYLIALFLMVAGAFGFAWEMNSTNGSGWGFILSFLTFVAGILLLLSLHGVVWS